MITLLLTPLLSSVIYSVICAVMEVIIGMVSTTLTTMRFGVTLGRNRLATVKVPLVHVIEGISARREGNFLHFERQARSSHQLSVILLSRARICFSIYR